MIGFDNLPIINTIAALGAYLFSVALWFINQGKNSQKSEDAIQHLEASIKELVIKIDKLIDGNTDIQSRLADHAARLTNLERNK